MKKKVLIIVTIIAVFVNINFVSVAYAVNERYMDISKNSNTVEQISEVLSNYLKSKNKNLEVGISITQKLWNIQQENL